MRCITIRVSVHHHARSVLARALPITHNYFMIVCNTAYDRARRFSHHGAQAVVEDPAYYSQLFYNVYNTV